MPILKTGGLAVDEFFLNVTANVVASLVSFLVLTLLQKKGGLNVCPV